MAQKTALIVDDSSLARMLVRKIFVNFKEWTLLEAKDGEEALAKLASTPVQLAMLDFNMPGMSGLELAEKFIEKQPDLAIYLVTANIQDRMQQRAEAMGIGFIKKPMEQSKIAAVLNAL
ncbi:MAG: response regulator [Magnetococcales bacterium]|nr:response regulator [Magnetococcales bacterium]